MKSEPIDLYYFSGTGNTLLIARAMQKALEARGKTVSLHRLEQSSAQDINTQHSLGLAFPVAVFSTYPFVWRFIEALPPGNGCEVFMFDTLAGFSGGIVGPLKKMLLQKGYVPIGAKEFIMPSNYLSVKSADKNQRKIQKALGKVDAYAEALCTGKARWRRIPVLSDIARLLSKCKKPWHAMGKKIRINPECCVRCGLCAKLCPVQAITLGEQGVQKDHARCEVCMRCISFCPAQAIYYQGAKTHKTYHAVTAQELCG